jgi:hypothetical protein
MSENKELNQNKSELDKIEKLHREAIEVDGCSDSDLEQVAGGGFEA